MARQLGGRAKALKGTSSDSRFEISNPANGDLLVYDSSIQLWTNTKILPEAITLQAALVGTSLTLSGALAAGSLTLTGDLNVAGTTTLGILNATTITATVLSFTSANISGALTVGGLLSGAAFSFSGAGNIAGALTVGSALAVTGALTAGSVTTSGAISGASLGITGNALVAGSLSVIGAVTGANAAFSQLDVFGNAMIAGDLTLGATGAVYSDNGIAFKDLNDSVNLFVTRGNYTLLSLYRAGITEVSRDPNGYLDRESGSLAVRNDSNDSNATLYIKNGSGTMGWTPVKDSTQEFEWCFLQIQMLKEALGNVLNADGSVGVMIEGDQ